ncbi:MAG: hypothetical protein NTX19_09410 [Gemmatimonadetes bacterium]|nr:hypothetical protein [Gemmatimonadota bacterium]
MPRPCCSITLQLGKGANGAYGGAITVDQVPTGTYRASSGDGSALLGKKLP